MGGQLNERRLTSVYLVSGNTRCVPSDIYNLSTCMSEYGSCGYDSLSQYMESSTVTPVWEFLLCYWMLLEFIVSSHKGRMSNLSVLPRCVRLLLVWNDVWWFSGMVIVYITGIPYLSSFVAVALADRDCRCLFWIKQ